MTSAYRTREHFGNGEKTTLKICMRCGVAFSRRLPRHHYKSCTAVVAAKQYKLELESTYVDVDPRTQTPDVANVTSTHTQHLEDSSDIFGDETTCENEASPSGDNDRDRGDVVSTEVAQYMASLPMIDTEYIMKCRHWQPQPTAISNKARLTLQFLSATCAGNGLSRNHMKRILTYIKSLQGADAAVLPDSIEGCWSTMEMVSHTYVHAATPVTIHKHTVQITLHAPHPPRFLFVTVM